MSIMHSAGGGYNSQPFPLSPVGDSIKDAMDRRRDHREALKIENVRHEFAMHRDAIAQQNHFANTVLGGAVQNWLGDQQHERNLALETRRANLDNRNAHKDFVRRSMMQDAQFGHEAGQQQSAHAHELNVLGVKHAHETSLLTQTQAHEANQNKLSRAAGTRQRNQEASLTERLGTNKDIQPGSASVGSASVSRPQKPKKPKQPKP